MKKLNEVLAEISVSQSMHYVYILHKPDGTPFYVGKGMNTRVASHEKEARSDTTAIWEGMNTLKLNTIRKIWREGGEIKYTIDSWHIDGDSANSREMELIAAIGRRCKNEGTLTNLTAGGEGVTDLPDEIKERISKKLQDYFANDPKIVENLQQKKNEWISNNPEEYAEVERRRLEICATEEVRNQVSETLKEFYKSNPDALEEMSERAFKQFADPAAREYVRQCNLKNNNAANLARWAETVDPSVLEAQHVQHSEFMKEWHSTEEGKEKTKQAAKKRNEKVRTEDHRQHMAGKTKEYIENNREAFLAVRAKATATRRRCAAMKQECMVLLRKKLIAEGRLIRDEGVVESHHLSKWRKKGWVTDFPSGLTTTYEEWKKLRDELQQDCPPMV